MDLPDELYVQNKFQLSFDKDGEIQSIYTYMYGRYENGDENTFPVSYTHLDVYKRQVAGFTL